MTGKNIDEMKAFFFFFFKNQRQERMLLCNIYYYNWLHSTNCNKPSKKYWIGMLKFGNLTREIFYFVKFYFQCWAVENQHEPFPKQALLFTCLLYRSFENIVVKGEIAHNEQFLHFPKCFLPIWRTFCSFHQVWNWSANSFSLKESKICRMGRGYLNFQVLEMYWSQKLSLALKNDWCILILGYGLSLRKFFVTLEWRHISATTDAITVIIILENYCDKSRFPQNLSFHFVLMKFPKNVHLSLKFSKNNHENYVVFHGRNMPPYKTYVILTQILFVTTLVKQGPGDLLFLLFHVWYLIHEQRTTLMGLRYSEQIVWCMQF